MLCQGHPAYNVNIVYILTLYMFARKWASLCPVGFPLCIGGGKLHITIS